MPLPAKTDPLPKDWLTTCLEYLEAIDDDLVLQIAAKSDVGHTHTASEVTDLSTAVQAISYTEGETDTLLAGKANASHTHTTADLPIADQPTAEAGTVHRQHP
jgi:hypothetical protein